MISDELGELIHRDSALYASVGLSGLILQRRGRGDLTDLQNIKTHPAHRLLQQYRNRGAPVVLATPPWSRAQIRRAANRGAHTSAREHADFLRNDMASMIHASQWIVLPLAMVEHLPGLRISPMGVVPQRQRRPRPIVDYTFSGINTETLPIAAMDSMQFGHALNRLLRRIVEADPQNGPVYLSKIDLADGFYRIWLRLQDILKLGVAIPHLPTEGPLVAFPLALPMGWCNSPPIFCTATETIADLANQ